MKYKHNICEKEEKAGDLATEIISIIRKYKTSRNISMNAPLKEAVIDCKDIKPVLDIIKKTMKIDKISIGTAKGLETERSKIKIEIKD